MVNEPGARPDRHFLPSIPATVFVGILAFVVFGFQEPLLNSDGDLARHLRHGQYMLEHHALITADPFSFSKAGQPFVAFEYGSQLLYTLVYRVGGLAGVTVFAALLIAATYALLARYLLRRGVEPLLAGITVAAAIISGMGHWLARPHLVTMVAVLVLLELLSPVGKWRLWPFAVLFAGWANLHGGFVYGLVLIGLFLAAAVLEARGGALRSEKVHRYAAALAIGAVAAVLTPHGIATYQHIVAMFGDRYIIDHTGEFASPDFHDAASKLFLGVLLLVIGSGLMSRRPAALPALLVVLAGVYFALVNQRNATLFGLTALPIMALHLDPEWRSLPWLSRMRGEFARASAGANTWGWVGVAAVLAAALGSSHGRLGGRQLIGDSFDAERLPVKAMQEARSANLTGRLFSDFAWGGYTLYAWPEQKVFIDGGTDFYGGNLMRDYSTIRSIRPGWRELVARWDFAVMVLKPSAPVAVELTHEGTWSYWYCDPTAVVILRRDVAATAPPARIRPGARECAASKGGDTSAS